MEIAARVVELSSSGEISGLGDYKFACLPSPKDRIVLPAVSGDLDIMEVLYVEHSPVKLSIDPDNRVEKYLKDTSEPEVMVYVQFAGRDVGQE